MSGSKVLCGFKAKDRWPSLPKKPKPWLLAKQYVGMFKNPAYVCYLMPVVIENL